MTLRALGPRTLLCSGFAALLFVTPTAWAQEGDQPTPPEQLPPCPLPPPQEAPPAPTHVKTERKHNIVFAPQEIAITTGGGVANYFGSGTQNLTDVGGTWDARLLFGAHSIIALEAAYVGSYNSLDLAGGVGHVSSNGIDTAFRLQGPWKVQPYIFGGVGWNFMSAEQPNTTVTEQGDNQVSVPAGGGLAGYIGRHTTLDLRGTYRFLGNNNLAVMNNASSLNQWMAQARLGYVF
jgi:hypothetical protein